MSVVVFDITLEGNRGLSLPCPVDHRELAELTSPGASDSLERRLVERALDLEARVNGLRVPWAIESWRLELITTGSEVHTAIHNEWEAYLRRHDSAQSAPVKKVAKCRSVLKIANRLLPKDVRDEAIDEWMDEIECAAAADLPVFRRTLSILLRSLPALAWRSRQPARARRGRAD